jgi:hypothetical protein
VCPSELFADWLSESLARAVVDSRFLKRCLDVGLIDPWLARGLLKTGPALGALASACLGAGPNPRPITEGEQLLHSIGGRAFVVFYAVPDEDPYAPREFEEQCVEWDAVQVVANDREEACAKVRAILGDRPVRPMIVVTRAQAAWFSFRVTAVDAGLVQPTPPDAY